MRDIDKIIVHCSATKSGVDISAQTIRDWHINGNGWTDIGYHYVIRLDGSIEVGRSENVVGAHTKGHNANSIGVCYVGGLDCEGNAMDTRTSEQRKALIDLLKVLKRKYWKAKIYGHNEFSSKTCPNFNATKTYDFISKYNF